MKGINLRNNYNSQEFWISSFLGIVWGNSLIGYFKGIFNHIPVLNNISEVLPAMMVLVPLLLSFKYLYIHLKSQDYIFFAICEIVYLINIAFFPENEEPLIKYAIRSCLFSMPFFLYGIILNVRNYYSLLTMVSTAAILVSFFYNVYYVNSSLYSRDVDTTEYSMHRSYEVLPFVLFMIMSTFQKYKWWKLAVSILGVLLIMSFGTRGVLLCVILFVALYFIFLKKFKYDLLVKGLLLFIALLLILEIDIILLFLYDLISSLGMSTRIFELYYNDEIGISEEREYIADTLYRILDSQDKFGGFGIFGSFRFVNAYPHKLYLDFWFTYGYVIGSILLAALFFVVLFGYIKSKFIEEKGFILLLVCASIVKLFLSSSYIMEPMFYLLIGYCVQIARKYR